METIEVRMEAPVAELRMNRPEVLNAANRQWIVAVMVLHPAAGSARCWTSAVTP